MFFKAVLKGFAGLYENYEWLKFWNIVMFETSTSSKIIFVEKSHVTVITVLLLWESVAIIL